MTDFLDSAIAAARVVADEGADEGAATRLRVRESLAGRGRVHKRRWTFIAAVIASLVGSTAFALRAGWQPPWSSRPAAIAPAPPAPPPQPVAVVTGRRRVVVHEPPIEEVVPPPSIEEAPATVEARSPAVAPSSVAPSTAIVAAPPVARPSSNAPSIAVAAPSSVAPPTAIVAAPSRPAVTAPSSRAPSVVTPSSNAPTDVAPLTPAAVAPSSSSPRSGLVDAPRSSSPSTISTSPAAAPRVDTGAAPDAELAAYRVAHTAHFRGGDSQAALAAWDAYLAKFPNGVLAPDARYDRALVLVKLARWRDARAALAPFASAPAGSYRQREAAQILAAIRDR